MILNGNKVIEIIAEKFESETQGRAFDTNGITKEFKEWMKDNKLIHSSNGKQL